MNVDKTNATAGRPISVANMKYRLVPQAIVASGRKWPRISYVMKLSARATETVIASPATKLSQGEIA